MQRMSLEHRVGLAAMVVGWEDPGQDPNLATVLWYALEPLCGEAPEASLRLAEQCRMPQIARWIWRQLRPAITNLSCTSSKPLGYKV